MSVIILSVPDSYSKVGLVVEAWNDSRPGFAFLDQDFNVNPGCEIRVSIPDEISPLGYGEISCSEYLNGCPVSVDD